MLSRVQHKNLVKVRIWFRLSVVFLYCVCWICYWNWIKIWYVIPVIFHVCNLVNNIAALSLQFIGACKEPVMVIVTELLSGGTLRKYLLNMRPKCLDTHVAIGFALDIARAIECLHSHGIIHRDLKPGNSLVCFHSTVNETFFSRISNMLHSCENSWMVV
jgi:serine/threonine protein kinase